MIYASALNGFAGHTTDVEELKQIGNMRAVFDDIIKYIPVRDDDPDGPLMLQICSLDYSSYVGKIGIGRVHRGRIRPNMDVAIMNGRHPEAREDQSGPEVRGSRASARR